MPATQQDRQSLDELRDAHRRRLRQLQLMAAKRGVDTPPHILTEIADIEAKLVELDETTRLVAQSPIDPELADALGPVGRFALINLQFYRVDSDISDLKKEVRLLRDDLRSLHDKFDQLLIGLVKEGNL